MQGQESDEIDQQRLITVKGVKEAVKGLWSGKKKDKMKKTLKLRLGRSMKRLILQTRWIGMKLTKGILERDKEKGRWRIPGDTLRKNDEVGAQNHLPLNGKGEDGSETRRPPTFILPRKGGGIKMIRNSSNDL